MTTEEKNGFYAAWTRLSAASRWLFAGLLLLVLAAIATAMLWTLRTDFQVLFSRLNEGDAASIVEELKELNIPYRLADGSGTILVPGDQVYETRLSLTASGMPLGGGVGFELFDNQGIGATEQSQRISYQRALQGELARTIGALEPVRQARVHLVMPESTLFKREREQARAAVALAFDPGGHLRAEQVSGIQRLVAASVPGLDPSRVVVSDEEGVVLSLSDASGRGTASTEIHLAIRKEVEAYITAKIARLLDTAFGVGQAIVSVDVTLNFDEITRTQQQLLPAEGVGSRGFVLREQDASRSEESGEQEAFAGGSRAGDNSATRDVQYEFSRQAEQVITAPGGITRLSVGVVVPRSIAQEQQTRIGDLVRMAAGIDESRGDALVIQSLDALGVSPAGNGATPTPAVEAEAAGSDESIAGSSTWQRPTGRWLLLLAAIAAAVLLGAFVVRSPYLRPTSRMTADEKEQLLKQLRVLLQEPVVDAKR